MGQMISLSSIQDPISRPAGTLDLRAHHGHAVLQNRNLEFLELLAAYRDSGGLARTHEVLASMRSRNMLSIEHLARWMVERQMISFDWQDQTWFPWFQFDREAGRPSPLIGEIVQVLCPFLDGWQVASWFVRPNVEVDHQVPLDELGHQPLKVLAAARASCMRYHDSGESRCVG